MVKSVDAATLKVALDSWEDLKKKDDFEKTAGTSIMKFLYEKCPKAKPMFGYDLFADVDDAMLADPKFIAHSMKLVSMFDTAFGMIGPEGSLLEEKIKELGEKHVNYGVQAEMFPIMGKALINMLGEQLGDAFTDDLKKAWQTVFSAISEDLMKTVLKSKK